MIEDTKGGRRAQSTARRDEQCRANSRNLFNLSDETYFNENAGGGRHGRILRTGHGHFDCCFAMRYTVGYRRDKRYNNAALDGAMVRATGESRANNYS